MRDKIISKYQSWSIFVFCYNEKGNIKKVILECLSLLNKFHNPKNELIIIDDGSSDGTTELLEVLIKEFPQIKYKFHDKNKGIGSALISGYKMASNENICAVPGDGQFDLNELSAFENIDEKVLVSFFRERNQHYPPFRKFLSWINKKLNAVFLNIKVKDVNWIKVYKKNGIENIDFDLTSSLVESEIFAKMMVLGFKVKEIPSVYHAREYGRTKGASLKTLSQAASELLSLIIIIAKFKKDLKRNSTPKTLKAH